MSGRRVLIVDDERALLDAVSRYFEKLGCTVLTAEEREEAEALLENDRFDLVILDLALTPRGREGLEILRDVRSSSYGTPVLVLSGLMTDELKAEVWRRGADAVLEKPQALVLVAREALALMGGGA